MIFVFFFLTYFTLYNILQVHPHLCKWHNSCSIQRHMGLSLEDKKSAQLPSLLSVYKQHTRYTETNYQQTLKEGMCLLTDHGAPVIYVVICGMKREEQSEKCESESVSHSVMSDFLRPHGLYCRLPGSSVHGILQARILEWVTFP